MNQALSLVLHVVFEALQSVCTDFNELRRSRRRDPLDPWRFYSFINTQAHSAKLMCGDQYRPLTLQCETVNTCNNLCLICAYPLQLRKKVIMSMPIFEKVLHDYSEMGGGYLSLTPVTGDILLDRHLLERLEIVKRYPEIREIGVTTNAAMLDRFSDSEVRQIVNGFGKLQISVYGLDEEEYTVMTMRKTYDRAVDGIKRILQVRTQNVYLAFRLLKPRTPQEVDDWIINEVGCKTSVEVNSIMTGDYANFTTLDTSRPLPFGASWSESSATKSQCLVPLLAVQVSSNGDVAFCPCVGALDDLIMGNIAKNTLLEIYNSPRARELWNWKRCGIPKSCAGCSFYIPLDKIRDDPSIIDNPFKLAGA